MFFWWPTWLSHVLIIAFTGLKRTLYGFPFFFCIETNNELESSIHEIEEKESMIEKLSAELEELKNEVQTKADERERLLRKRKSLNEECNSLQKKLHYCDSLLKFVPKENLDS